MMRRPQTRGVTRVSIYPQPSSGAPAALGRTSDVPRRMLPTVVASALLLVGVLALAGTVATAVAAGAASTIATGLADRDAQPTDQLIVRFAAGTPNGLDALSTIAGEPVRPLRQVGDGAWVLKLPGRHTKAAVEALAARWRARPGVVLAEPDAMSQPTFVPNDPSFPSQWDDAAPTSGSYGANLPGAWDITTGSTNVVVAVLDTGKLDHVDLAGRFLPGYDMISGATVANDGGGRDSDPSDPGDWVTSADSASGTLAGCAVHNSTWHGTHVAGTIGAASNNGIGVAGINHVSKILPVRVLGKCGGYNSDIADGIRWAAGLSVAGVPANPNPAKVINMSLGGSGACSATYQSAISAAVAAGTVVVVAAGNSNADAVNFEPADCVGVVAVAATNPAGSRSYYSNYGTTVKIAAPGGEMNVATANGVLSTLNTGTTVPAADSYAYYQGTSMASPHVAGIASLLFSVNPTLTPAQVLALLQSTVTAFPAGSTCTVALCGSGIVNAAAAVAATVPTTPPMVTSLTPTVGTTGGGTTVTIAGSGFTGTTSVRFGPTAATSFVVVNDTKITAVSPARTAGLVTVFVQNTGGTNASLSSAWFSFVAPPTSAPTVTSLTPNIGTVAGGTPVTIKGTGFLTATSVRFGPTAQATFTVVNDTTINAISPPYPAALVNVWITNPIGTNPSLASSWYSFRLLTGPAPTVTAISPASGTAAGGQMITILGTGFTGANQVRFATTGATSFVVVDATTITAVTPARPVGLVNVFVTTQNGTNPNLSSSWYRFS